MDNHKDRMLFLITSFKLPLPVFSKHCKCLRHGSLYNTESRFHSVGLFYLSTENSFEISFSDTSSLFSV